MTVKEKLPKAELESQLDEALKDTFPASDPVSVGDVTADKPDRPFGRKPAKIDKALVEKLARQVAAKTKGAA
ncbi:hypothetical protein [Hyphomicrobium sp. DMF-1]|uniref:hypothetical protein n=1 Tax=Hyphomicrobium sp. DMF-1 TaxID=3019544 RepID=UPI0022EBCC9B|nr:hypothetical protein [Hyphomicrobium sp. DMF-1]WBT40480.1 hypothetical protein PE058_01170 [Hyphomicrobium sp. DMF-1]